MILSHRHKFIFLKTRKTAGTSIEIALSTICGPEDVITPIMPADEEIRANMGARGPQNYLVPMSNYGFKDWARLFIKRRRRTFYNHIPAKHVRNIVGNKIWNSYFKFSVVRNPFDQAVSRYFWKTRNLESPPSISEFLRESKLVRCSNWDIFSIDNKVVMDHMIRFENLENDFRYVLRRLGIDSDLRLPLSKTGLRPARPASQLIDSEARETVNHLCSRELREFGYEWNG